MDDIIFGGSSHSLVSSFSDDMSRVFEMLMMGELQFFLGLHIKQTRDGTFVHQAKYTKDMLKKFVVLHTGLTGASWSVLGSLWTTTPAIQFDFVGSSGVAPPVELMIC